MTITDTARLRGLELAHNALDAALSINRRRTGYVAPRYLADMSQLNAELDRLLAEDEEPPC
jgi:hypothetical protein